MKGCCSIQNVVEADGYDEAGQLGQNYFCSSFKCFFDKTHSRLEKIARQLMRAEMG
ncbi:hypothetical protein [Lacrimispora sphenoides]|uniref:hypothetical protein n=1 Tax=Lacrimispora sphenoides TaxID=29370 RepID=UPI000ACC3C87|nr:hypothetical protein [Lacrimispora sphenoides]